jgi:hypothetical protein
MAKQSHDPGVKKARKNLILNPPPLTRLEKQMKWFHDRGLRHKAKDCRLC